MLRVDECIGIGVLETGCKECIVALIRGAQRFHFASLQDNNPVVAARHNAYAVALMDALRDIATKEEVIEMVGEDPVALRQEILAFQDKIEGQAFEIVKALKAKGIALPF